jgi:hypothetical protein
MGLSARFLTTPEEETMDKIKIDTEKFTPCGYCRRCSLHDDPGGCLEVYAYERELIAAGLTPREILMAGQDASGCLPVDFERQVEIFEHYVAEGYYEEVSA